MGRPFDIRQSIYRSVLTQLTAAAGRPVDKILESLDSETRPLFRIVANGTSTVTVEAGRLTNPETSVNRAAAPIGGYIDPVFTSGTAVFPTVSGANIVVTTTGLGTINVPLVLSSGKVCKVLFYVTSTGQLYVKVGAAANTVSTAVIPSLPNNCYSIGYVIARNPSGTISVISPSDVFRFDGQTFASYRNNTGFVTWDPATSYPHHTMLTAPARIRIDHGGSGYILGTYVSWSGNQTSPSLVANKTNYIYIDSTGQIGSIDTPSASLYQNNVVLFEVLYDGTTTFVVKESHGYDMELEVSRFLHDNVGTVISGTGANIERVATGSGGAVGDRQLKIVGAAKLEDHGLTTTIPDSGGSAITWNHFYLNASLKWVRHLSQSAMPMVYRNSSGVVTSLNQYPAAGSVGILTIYVSKDDFGGTPLYITTINGDVPFDTVNDAKNAITNGTYTAATNELKNLEVARLGSVVIVNNASGGYIAERIIDKDTAQASSTGTSGTLGDHSALSNLLEDTHAQYALLAGRLGGQVLTGGTANSNNLTLRSTSGSTKGKVLLDESTASTSTTTGALVVAGGVGIGGALFVGSGIFVTTATGLDTENTGGTLNIGATKASTINIGRSTATVNILGALQSVQATNVEITDNLVMINKGGVVGSATGSGFVVQNLVTAPSTYQNVNLLADLTLASKWKIGYAGSESEIITAGTVQTITGYKSFTNASFSRVIQDTVIRSCSGYSSSITASTLYVLGELTMGGDSQHLLIRGKVWAGITSVTEFDLLVRSNVLPSKTIYFSTRKYINGMSLDIVAYENPTTGRVVIGYQTSTTALSIRWEITEFDRESYNSGGGYWTNSSSLTILNTSGLTPIAATGSYSVDRPYTFTDVTLSKLNLWSLPGADGTANQLLGTNGSGALGWITSPAFTNFTNANHDHSGAASGGLVVAASATQQGSVTISAQTFAGLKTFSGGVSVATLDVTDGVFRQGSDQMFFAGSVNEFHWQPNTNSDAIFYINYYGYNRGATRKRATRFYDGTGSAGGVGGHNYDGAWDFGKQALGFASANMHTLYGFGRIVSPAVVSSGTITGGSTTNTFTLDFSKSHFYKIVGPATPANTKCVITISNLSEGQTAHVLITNPTVGTWGAAPTYGLQFTPTPYWGVGFKPSEDGLTTNSYHLYTFIKIDGQIFAACSFAMSAVVDS